MSVVRGIEYEPHAPLGDFRRTENLAPVYQHRSAWVRLVPMSTKHPTSQERTDGTAFEPTDICHDATLLGRDGSGVEHYWSIYSQTVIVHDGDDTATIALPASKGDVQVTELRDWVEHVETSRGWERLLVSGSLVDDLATMLDA